MLGILWLGLLWELKVKGIEVIFVVNDSCKKINFAKYRRKKIVKQDLFWD